jgi:putative FmdB family regulatory protein
MPNYSYLCEDCGVTTDHMVSYTIREDPQQCKGCNSHNTVYQFPLTSNIWGVLDYHDESLGVDIHGRNHRKQVMKAMGVQEAGDTQGGARNFESNNATGIMPLQGVEHGAMQRKQEEARIAQENKVITTFNKDGSERSSYRHGDLGSDGKVIQSQQQ